MTETGKAENPHYTKLRSELSQDFADVARANGTYEDFALFADERNYGWTEG